ncbi:ABC transporter permease [Acidicapsa acidisoli]|uniref:ABC transporter permease n=1 Tax=Acidicapsa acidisoli TaxID=1615681 RepID=UPI0021DFE5D0|nr:ABC transporter permease [Acidicapsa acidisoli]
MKPFRYFLARLISQPGSWLRAVVQRNRLEAEMEAELASHLENLTADLVRAGYSKAEAARRARIALGSTVVHKDEMRASLGLRLWDELLADLRYAARRLRRSLGFTAVATISLALAIGANTTIFSLAKQLLYERLAVPNAAELRLLAWTGTEKHVAVHHIWGDDEPLVGGRASSTAFAYPVYLQLRSQNSVMQDLFAFKETGMNATIEGSAQQVQTELVSGNYYSVLHVKPVLGRSITPADDASPGQSPIAVISYGLWQRSFGGLPSVIGRVIKVNETPLTIVGVNPMGFTGAKSTLQSPDIFMPVSMQPLVYPRGDHASLLDSSRDWWLNIMGRAKPGVPDATAQAALDGQLNAIVRATMPVRPIEDVPRMDLRDGSRGLFNQERQFAKPMTVLLVMVGFVLLLACANIANLMLARGSQRQREMSVRMAMGAGRARIARQMLVESLLLASLGGVGGLALGYLGSNLIARLTENSWEPNYFHIHFDWQVFGFTAGVTLLTGILFGLAPAWAAARAKVSVGLKETSQSVTRRRKGWGGRSLVGFQIALSTLLVIGAGLFLRTLASLNSVDAGFRTDHLLLAEISPPQRLYPAGKDISLHKQLVEKFASLPGVEAVSPAWVTYLSGDISRTDFIVEGQAYDKTKDDGEDFNVVGYSFFSMLRIPILAGRGFGSQDTATSAKVGIINASLAKERFPGQNPVGKRFSVNGHDSDGHGVKATDDWITIVGVCGDTRYFNLREEPPPQFLLPFTQQSEAGGAVAYEIQTRINPEQVIPMLRKVAQQIDPDLPLLNVRTQEQQIQEDMQQERIFVSMTSGFGLLALALASVGIYGIMAYSVANRTNEIGIRLALGALPRQVLAMVLREATWISLAGIAVGVGAALVLAQAVKSMLYGLEPADPVSLIAGAALLIAVGLAASWLPARRAASVQPVEALRHE